jgi:protein-S-isoprenylcysteine O-methyltransferase Ste14
MRRISFFLYGVVCYLIFLGTFLYAVGFVANVAVPRGIDSPPTRSPGQAAVVDAVLLLVFALQHSVMARQGFKRVWTKIVPAALERSTFVLFASLALILLFWKWQPIGGAVWDVRDPFARMALQGVSLAGWGIVLLSTFLINHFDLFGLRQVFSYLRGVEYTALEFRRPLFYNYVRHPIYLGFILAFWATPTMTLAHLVFALATTGYILVAIQLEERDLVRNYGSKYEAYRHQVSMLVPRVARRHEEAAIDAAPSAPQRNP